MDSTVKMSEQQGHEAFNQLIPALSLSLDPKLEMIEAQYHPHQKRNAIVVLPGGGYEFTSFRESRQVALAFSQVGFDAFIVHYTCCDNHEALQNGGVGLKAVYDVARALNYIKEHFNYHKICVAGFSAGGHLASLSANLFSALQYQNQCSQNNGGKESKLNYYMEQLLAKFKRDFPHFNFNSAFDGCILSYPVISSQDDITHQGSFISLTGSLKKEEHAKYSVEKLTGPYTPPSYIWHTQEDNVVSYKNSLLYAQSLWQHQVIAELNIFPQGVHGLSLSTKDVEPDGNFIYAIEHNAQWFMRAIRFIYNYIIH